VPETIEFYAFVFANLGVLALGSMLALLSLAAHRRSGTPSLRIAAVGFGLIALGSVLDAVYELGVGGSFQISGRELMLLHTSQTILVGVGLAVLFLALRRY